MRAHAQNAALRLVDDRKGEQRAADAVIGERDVQAAAHFFGLEFAGAARLARPLTARAMPSRERLSACLMTGTMRPSSPSETAMPR